MSLHAVLVRDGVAPGRRAYERGPGACAEGHGFAHSGRHETRNPRQQYAPEAARLLAAACRWRRAATDRTDYCCLVEAVLNLEGGIHWTEDLLQGIAGGEYELECPDPDGCATVWVAMGERGWFSTVDDHAFSDDADIETLPLRPAAPDTLDGLGRRLYELALSDGHEDVARSLTHAFGEATCPECGECFSVVGQVVAGAC